MLHTYYTPNFRDTAYLFFAQFYNFKDAADLFFAQFWASCSKLLQINAFNLAFKESFMGGVIAGESFTYDVVNMNKPSSQQVCVMERMSAWHAVTRCDRYRSLLHSRPAWWRDFNPDMQLINYYACKLYHNLVYVVNNEIFCLFAFFVTLVCVSIPLLVSEMDWLIHSYIYLIFF